MGSFKYSVAVHIFSNMSKKSATNNNHNSIVIEKSEPQNHYLFISYYHVNITL